MSARWTTLLATLGLLSCAPIQTGKSRSKGEFESFSPAELLPLKGQLRVLPEYGQVTRQVFVASDLLFGSTLGQFQVQTNQLGKAIIDAGANLVIVGPRENTNGIGDASLASFRAYLSPDGLDPIGNDSAMRELHKKVRLLSYTASFPIKPWARDWAPLFAIGPQGPRLIDFNYISDLNAEEFPRFLADRSGVERISLPLYFEGGNLIISGQGHCLVASSLFRNNLRNLPSGVKPIDRETVKSNFRDYVGCKIITELEPIPYEGTGHVDVGAKLLSDELALVHVLTDETLKTVPSDASTAIPGTLAVSSAFPCRGESLKNLRKDAQHMEQLDKGSGFISQIFKEDGSKGRLQLARDMQRALEINAARLEAAGFKVKRVPLPAPYFVEDKIGPNECEARSVVRSTVNALIVNQSLLIPRYTLNATHEDYTLWYDQSLSFCPGCSGKESSDQLFAIGDACTIENENNKLRPCAVSPSQPASAYEMAIANIAKEEGYKTIFVNSDRLIQLGGAVHCVSETIVWIYFLNQRVKATRMELRNLLLSVGLAPKTLRRLPMNALYKTVILLSIAGSLIGGCESNPKVADEVIPTMTLHPSAPSAPALVVSSEGMLVASPPSVRKVIDIPKTQKPLDTFTPVDHEFKSESFTQDGSTPALDILLVIDDSNSMTEEQINLSTKLDDLLSEVKVPLWQIAVITSSALSEKDSDACELTLIKPSDYNHAVLFRKALTPAINPRPGREGFRQALTGLRCPQHPWIRPQSRLAVIVISDEDNCSGGGPDCESHPLGNSQALVRYVEQDLGRVVGASAGFYGIFSPPASPCVTAGDPGVQYQKLVDYRSNGRVHYGNICEDSYKETLQRISENMALLLSTQFTLKHMPNAGSVEVKGVKTDRSAISTRDFRIIGKTLVFVPGREPALRTEIQVSYQVSRSH